LAAGVACCLLFQSAQASLVLSDGFNYTSGGNLSGNGSWNGGFSTTYVTVGSGNLTYPGLADFSPSGNEASVLVNNTAGTSSSPWWTAATFSSAPSSGDVYASFLLNYSTIAAGANYTFMGLLPTAGNTGTFSSANDPVDMAEKTVTGGYELGVRSYGGSAVYGTTPPVLTLGTTYLVVLDYSFSAKTVSLFIDPTLGGAPEGTPTAVSTAGTKAATDLDSIYLRSAGNQAAGGGVASPPFLVDDVRIGTTWADVTPAAVPEPTAVTLVGLGVLGLGLARRMRRGLAA
jgi:hypothetical protein